MHNSVSTPQQEERISLAAVIRAAAGERGVIHL